MWRVTTVTDAVSSSVMWRMGSSILIEFRETATTHWQVSNGFLSQRLKRVARRHKSTRDGNVYYY